MIPPTLPSAEYGLYIPEDRAIDARLFTNRKALVGHCKTLLPDKPIIAEVGVFSGFFSEFLLSTFQPHKLHLIDTFAASDHVTGLFAAANHLAFIKAKFAENPEVSIHQGMSWEKLSDLGDNSCDFIYIDADHGYESVQKDIASACHKIKSGGIIQFNDYTNYGSFEKGPYGVLDAVNEFIESHTVHLVGFSLERSGYHDLAVRVIKPGPTVPGLVPTVPGPVLTVPGPVPTVPGIVLVTPCSRPENLEQIKASINFSRIDKWYIIYDTRHFEFEKHYEGHPQIIELECKDVGVVGHQIRNMALGLLATGLVYFLDDDNTVHPNFWKIAERFNEGELYTFDMAYSNGMIRKGDNPTVANIDTAQYVFSMNLINTLRFDVSDYSSDGIFINSLWNANKDKWTYIPEVAATYNKLRPC